ncbi:MAG: hypothetical protein ABS79_01335 [Planctomycetes bacterium SCN 63-9]|nr:MAG: hypothetical protein ABS79_01335 [Planctomycetes bacterium SCN 63-9]
MGLSSAAQAQVKLEQKYPPGRSLKHKTKIRTQQVLTLNGMAIETEAKETILTAESIGKAGEDSTTPLSIKIEGLKAEISLPGGLNVNFDSAEPNAKIEPPQLAFLGEVFRLVSDVNFKIVLDKDNKFKAVEGTEAIREKAEKLSEPGKLSVMGRLGPDRLKMNFEQAQAKIPDILVRLGDTWERTEVLELEAGQTLTFRKKYEYLGTEKQGGKTLDKIGVKTTEVKYAQDPAVPTPLKVADSNLKVDSTSGTILFDREAGYTTLDSSNTRIKGTIDFTAGGQKLPGELDLTFEIESEVQPPAR